MVCSTCRYTMAKYGMSLCVLGMAAEFRDLGMRSMRCATHRDCDRALNMIRVTHENARTPEIVADAAHAILSMPSRAQTGGFLIDDEVLAAQG